LHPRLSSFERLQLNSDSSRWPIGKGVQPVYFYKVLEVDPQGKETLLVPDPVAARPAKMSDAELVASIQEATFRYFWNHAHPESGLTRGRYHVAQSRLWREH
jgi:hypothetical protein